MFRLWQRWKKPCWKAEQRPSPRPCEPSFRQRDRPLSAGTRKTQVVIVPRLLGALSPTPSAGSPVIVTVASTVPSTISFDVVARSPVPTSSVQSPQALLIGSPGALSFQMGVTEDDPFVHEVRSLASMSVVATPSANAAATTESTISRETSNERSDATIQLEAKEPKR